MLQILRKSNQTNRKPHIISFSANINSYWLDKTRVGK